MADEERTIVVGMDGSEWANMAFDWYMDNAHRKTDHVILVHTPQYHSVVQSPMVMADVTVLTDMWKEEEKRVKEFLQVLGQKLKDRGIGGKVKSVGGVPGEVICDVAKDTSASMIVTGCRGLGKVRRTFMGSVSDYVLHHAHCPVLVVRHKHHEHHGDKKEH